MIKILNLKSFAALKNDVLYTDTFESILFVLPDL